MDNKQWAIGNKQWAKCKVRNNSPMPFSPLPIAHCLYPTCLPKIIRGVAGGHRKPVYLSIILTMDYYFLYKLPVMKKIIFYLLGVFLLQDGLAQSWAKEYDHVDDCVCGLSLVGKGDKHGFVNKEGKLIVPLIYDEALTFSEGMAAVKANGKWGFIDSTGKEIVSLKYTDAMSFHDGFAVVSDGNKYGYIDKSGKIIIALQYDNARSFSEGLAPVMNSKMRWGYIDISNKIVIPYRFVMGDMFDEGLARVMDTGGTMYYIDKSGKKVKDTDE